MTTSVVTETPSAHKSLSPEVLADLDTIKGLDREQLIAEILTFPDTHLNPDNLAPYTDEKLRSILKIRCRNRGGFYRP